MKASIFLSASIPKRGRFLKNLDILAIREATLALVAVSLPEHALVFGGHPAITPLVQRAAETLGALDRVFIYQSRYFAEVLPEEAHRFSNLIFTRNIDQDRPKSLLYMRELMIDQKETPVLLPPFRAAFFIGGMEGVLDEYELFRQRHPYVPVFPVGSSGAAAAELMTITRGLLPEELLRELHDNRQYRGLFRRLLGFAEGQICGRTE